MPNPKIMSETPLGMAELKDELEEMKKKEELNFRAAKTVDYLEHFIKAKTKDTKEIYAKISKLDVPRLKDAHIVKIVDFMPQTVDDLKTLLQGYTITVSAENMKKIVDLTNEYAK